MESAQHHQTIPPAGGSRRGRLCQRSYPENGGNDGSATLIQEQNSHAGVTNKLLAKKACKICVAYEGMEKFFPAEKIIMTGNPVRQNLLGHSISARRSRTLFRLGPRQKTILILGGSLGARTINQTLTAGLDIIRKNPDIQFIWQTGKIYIAQVRDAITTATGEAVHHPHQRPSQPLCDRFHQGHGECLRCRRLGNLPRRRRFHFEFCLLHKPVILVPSPNVAEDHQTKNALALVDKDAAIYVKDAEAKEKPASVALETVKDNEA